MLLREDESPDANFYLEPRFVTHIDDATIAALTELYRELLPARGDVLDLMSSWISHLPADLPLGRVAGLGMNARELAANERLDEYVVHDLNADPRLPYSDSAFDAVLNTVSIQYLTRPLEVLREVSRVLRPGGLALVAMSHRLFPTKAIAGFRSLPPQERMRLVEFYVASAPGFEKPWFIDRSPANADPLWVVAARRSANHGGASTR
jgi:SAM-dependent methyltransferase